MTNKLAPSFLSDPTKGGRLVLGAYRVPTLADKPATDTKSPTVGGYYKASGKEPNVSLDTRGIYGCSLRVEDAGEAYRGTTGYYGDEEGFKVFVPVVARLSRSRGFIVGYRMSDGGECITLAYSHSYSDRDSARLAAHNYTAHEAEKEREFQAEENERIREEENERIRKEEEENERNERANMLRELRKKVREEATGDMLACVALLLMSRDYREVTDEQARAALRFQDYGFNCTDEEIATLSQVPFTIAEYNLTLLNNPEEARY
jgi:hypothetical protein